MESEFKSVEAVNPNAWVEHFKSTIGKPAAWGMGPKLVLLKKGSGQHKQTTSKDLPLNVVSPVEQYANMAQAEVDKTTPKYTAPSVASKTPAGEGKRKKRKRKKGGEKKSSSAHRSGKGKRRKTQGDIFN